jgi:dihydroflavonol-4-reductase
VRVFVTGGNGFIGSRVVRALVGAGHAVRCLLRPSSDTRRISDLPYEPHLGDVRDVASLRAGAAGCDGIIHLASLSAWSQIRSPRMREIVIDGTRHVLEAAEAAGGARVVFVSSATAVDGRPTRELLDESTPFRLPPEPFVYAHAKHEAEGICAAAAARGLPVVTVNPCEVYGPEDHDFITASYLRDTLKDWPAFATDGGTAVAHVDDVAAGIVAALERGRSGERYILGGDNLSVEQIIRATLELGGQPHKTVLRLPTGPTLIWVRALAKLGLPTPVDPDLLAHGVLWWHVSSAKAQAELGYRWRPHREVLADVVGWLQRAGHVPAPKGGA